MTKINCPSCKQIIEVPGDVMNQHQLTCPHCRHQFDPQPFFAPPTPSAAVPAAQVAAIESVAMRFTRLAVLFVVLGIIGLIVGGFVAIRTGNFPWAWTDAFSCFLAATWFYLIAQVIHIRALLARRP